MRGIFLCLVLCTVAAVADARPPNVIVIMADDLGWGDLSCHGATAVQTPHIDRLAREGRRFTSGYCSASTCITTRFTTGSAASVSSRGARGPDSAIKTSPTPGSVRA